jgi:hypothetical protein
MTASFIHTLVATDSGMNRVGAGRLGLTGISRLPFSLLKHAGLSFSPSCHSIMRDAAT